MTAIAMIPARLGSQRLIRKNLREINGVPLITWAIRKCKASKVFDEIWVNSEGQVFGEIAELEGVRFHKRPAELASNQATSEDYIAEFSRAHDCEYLFQVHSIAPLLQVDEIRDFVHIMLEGSYDVQLSVVHEQIECAMEDIPLNFSFDRKTNSQELPPIQRITWSITGWRTDTYLRAFDQGKCATYAGKVGYYVINRASGHVIKNEEDLQIAQSMMNAIK
jgi:CMP-N-acetylneuraminic acid synthetase